MLQEFKDFAIKGNVVDLAVGMVIGGAFGKIVTALVNHLVTPPIGMAMGGVDFSKLGSVLNPNEVAGGAEPVILGYGAFFQSILDFIIIAFAIFLVVKLINSAKKKEEAAAGPSDNDLLIEIRDALKK